MDFFKPTKHFFFFFHFYPVFVDKSIYTDGKAQGMTAEKNNSTFVYYLNKRQSGIRQGLIVKVNIDLCRIIVIDFTFYIFLSCNQGRFRKFLVVA